jgi:TP901 family phage tail tape measure protein
VANRTVKVTVQADVTGAIANLKVFTASVKEMGSELDRAAAKHPERLNKIANATGVLGLGAAAAFAGIVKVASDFDAQMSRVVAVSDDGAKSLAALRQAALNAGRDTAYTATQAAQAEEELAKAGVSTADILGGALTGALNLAAAGSLDLDQAATVAAQALTEFGLQGKDVGHIADVLTAGANKSTADVSGLGNALGQVGGLAHQMGMSMEDTVGVLARFSQGGMQGEEAGTTLKQVLMDLINPTDKSAQLMKQLGINMYDAHGAFVGIAGAAAQLQAGLGQLDQQQRNAALSTLFGARSIRGATILYQEGLSGINDWINAVNDSGAASQTASTKLDNLQGDLHKLLGSLQAVAVSSSGGASAGLRDIAQAAEGAVNNFLKLPQPLQEAAVVLLGISGAGLLAAAGLLKVKTTATQAMDALRNIGPMGEKAAAGLSVVGKIGGAAVGITIAVEGLVALNDWLQKKFAPVHHDLDQLATDMRNFAESGHVAGLVAQVYGDSLGKLANDIFKVTSTQQFLASKPVVIGPHGQKREYLTTEDRKAFEQAKVDIADLDKAMSNLVANGGATQAKIAFDDMTQALEAQGVPMSEIIQMFPQYEAAAANAAAGTAPLAQGFGNVSQNAHTMANGLQDAIEHGQTLEDVFKQLNGAAISVLGTEIDVKQALADLTEKFKRGKDAIDDNTQAGRDNLKLIMDSIEAAEKAAQAKYDETGSVQAATDTYNAYIAKLKDELHHLGLTDAQVNTLIDTYARLPPAVSTNVSANGLSDTQSRLDKVDHQLDMLNGKSATMDVTVNVNASRLDKVQHQLDMLGANRWGGLYEHAAAGVLRDASLYSAANPGRYMIAEPQTGGEAFIPRRGDLRRSRSIADYVVSNWLGGATSWGGAAAAGGGGGVINMTVYAGMGTDGAALGAQIAEKLRPYVASMGGNVQAALGRRGQ